MKKLKLMTIIGTRPDIIKLSEVIKKCDKYFNHVLVHTGQNYDYRLNGLFFEDLGLREPDVHLNVVGENLGQMMGYVVAKSYELMLESKPDAVLILGDTNSSLSVIAAKRLKIPIFHMEAGNRCFDQNLPEEINRKIVDHTADVNLPYSENARRNLLSEGIAPEYTFVTGSPMREIFEAQKDKINSSDILERLDLKKGQYIVLSAHREENIDNEIHFNNMVDAVNGMAEHFNMPVIYSVHPRSAKKLKERNIIFNDLVREMQPFSFSDYNSLQNNSFCVVSDSGTLAEESSINHFAAVSLRTSTERQEAFECGSFVLGGLERNSLINSVHMAVEKCQMNINVQAYANNNVSDIVVNVIQSYTGIVNDRLWRKGK